MSVAQFLSFIHHLRYLAGQMLTVNIWRILQSAGYYAWLSFRSFYDFTHFSVLFVCYFVGDEGEASDKE